MTMTNRIEMSPKVMMGKPVIRGTRIPIELILRKLGEGATAIYVLDADPHLTKADIQAAIGYAADTVAPEEAVLVGAPPAHKRTKRESVRFLADENCDFSVVRALRAAGHDVRAVAELADSFVLMSPVHVR
jgi:uncharacterized protein (DUF433 family)